MEYRRLVHDFVERTKQNLEFVEKTVQTDPEARVYEVTQLVNSLLGLIIFPKERYFENIPIIPFEQLREDGWVIPRVRGDFAQVEDLRKLMRYLRNSIAHSNLEFISNGHSLTGIRLWNCHRDQKNWEVELTVVELRGLAYRFIDLILSESNDRGFAKRAECQGRL